MIYFLIIFFLLYVASGANAHEAKKYLTYEIKPHGHPHTSPTDMKKPSGAKTAEATEKKKEQEKKQKEVDEQEKDYMQVALMEQCFLLDNIKSLMDTKATYDSISIIDGNPTEVFSRLNARTGQSALMDLRNEELALLQPSIRLFKQKYTSGTADKPVPKKDGKGNPEMEELIFHDFHHDPSPNWKDPLGPSAIYAGVGLQSLDYELLGGNPTLGKNWMQSVTLTFWMDSIQALAKKASGGPAFVDMIADPSTSIREPKPDGKGFNLTKELNPAYKTLHMRYGWAVPPDKAKLIRKETRRAIRDAQVMLRLKLVSTEINLEQNGTATLTIKYQAWQDQTMDAIGRDVLKIDSGYHEHIKKLIEEDKKSTERTNSDNADFHKRLARQKKRGLEKEKAEEKDKAQETKEKEQGEAAEARRADIKKEKINAREMMYKAFLETMEKTGKIFFVDVDAKEYLTTQRALESERELYKSMTPEQKLAYDQSRATTAAGDKPKVSVGSANSSAALGKVKKTMEKSFDKQAKAAGGEGKDDPPTSAFKGKSKAEKAQDGKTKRIYFMKFGDILNTAASYTELKPEESTIVTGPVAWRDARTKQLLSYNLTDMPVALEHFQVWWIKEVITTQKDEWTLSEFVKSATGKLIVNALGNRCYAGGGKMVNKTSLVPIDNVKGSGAGGVIPPLKRNKRHILNDIPIKSGPDPVEGPWHSYIYIYVHAFTMGGLNGNKNDDSKRGIYHFRIGNSKGLVKEIKFKKTDNKYQASGRILRNMAEDPNDEIGLERLYSQYNADLSLVGNAIFKPGMFIYINPTIQGLGDIRMKNSIARRVGLGGYYLVTKVGGQISGGEGWNTNLTAVWQNFGGVMEGAPVKVDPETPKNYSSPEDSPSCNPAIMSCADPERSQ